MNTKILPNSDIREPLSGFLERDGESIDYHIRDLISWSFCNGRMVYGQKRCMDHRISMKKTINDKQETINRKQETINNKQ